MSDGVETLPGREGDFAQHRTSRVLGCRLLWYPEVDSTNALLRAHAEGGAPEGLVVAADVQTHGRGRGKNAWASPDGGLWFSVLLRPRGPTSEAVALMPRAAEAVKKALGTHAGLTATVKPPNDVLVEGRKICGILAEAATVAGADHPEWVVLGCGVNLTNAIPEELADRATRLAAYVTHPPSREQLLAWILASLEEELGIAPGR